MATAYAQPTSALQSPREHFLQPNTPPQPRKHASRQRFAQEFSQCLYDFVIQLLPTAEELAVKEDVRKLLERLIRTIEPDSRLLQFGSTANGFSLRNSDMDLCCLIDSEERLAATDLVNMAGDLLERETKFHVKPLPHARIPIVKLSLDPAPGLPYGIACDIGFENRLALENTRLLMCYAMIDPPRVRTMVLFLKVWSKRRKINSPYKGTLSSYGYVLLVIYFLVHVKSPPVLPNLQVMPPLRPISKEETHLNGHNIWFFDDIELLRQRWKSSNTDSVAELLIDFFKFYSREFQYSHGVASIRAGLLTKDSKGWESEYEKGSPRERNRLCIEDPFEVDYNVSRCVTKDGLYTIRGEFMRASRILATRPDRAIVALAQLCEERKEEELVHPLPNNGLFIPPRLSPLPPQVPYTVNSSPMRPARLPVADQVSPSDTNPSSPSSPPTASSGPSSPPQQPKASPPVTLPVRLDQLEHMAPRRGKWTSPPPPDAPEEDRSAFENRLGQSLSLATAPSPARHPEHPRPPHPTSSNASEAYTDDDSRSDISNSDDVRSVQSFVEEGAPKRRREKDRESEREPTVTLERQQLRQMHTSPIPFAADPSSSRSTLRQEGGMDPRMLARIRGRPALRLAQQQSEINAAAYVDAQRGQNSFTPPPRIESPRRSLSGPARTSFPQRLSQMAIPNYIPNNNNNNRAPYVSLADYQSPQQPSSAYIPNGNIFYETTPAKDRLSRAVPYTFNMSPVSPISPQQHFELRNYYDSPISSGASSSPSSSPRHMSTVPQQMSSSQRQPAPRHLPPSLRRSSKLAQPAVLTPPPRYETTMLSPTTVTYSHSHTHSSATITSATTPRAHIQSFANGNGQSLSPSLSRSRSPHGAPGHPHSRPHSRQQLPPRLGGGGGVMRPASPFASISSGSASPPMSCTSSLYAPSCSPLSTSPPSPAQSDTFGKQAAAAVPAHAPLVLGHERLQAKCPEHEESPPTSRPKDAFDTDSHRCKEEAAQQQVVTVSKKEQPKQEGAGR
ncbi:uncharacterized protein C8Q71DRAFT_139441 [Rhodofomes roseus]|uniref:polynucleotide adenylyltransferase n=1 Tax=Rhodofomes roseus TaxID=34475 RepID=A0ABQ8KAT7_9APHY|nr:uncharacterized protein C8Q71DRAFT_139441 [Rhodofomes roseus]KAH9834392.1 hypothetical protein C8Q71DRAFT_139441 [Rhodofomes roseus]